MSLITILSIGFTVPSQANDLGKILGMLAAGYITYEIIDNWNNIPDIVTIPTPNYNPPRNPDINKEFYDIGYKDGIDNGINLYGLQKYNQITFYSSENEYWYGEGYNDGFKDGVNYYKKTHQRNYIPEYNWLPSPQRLSHRPEMIPPQYRPNRPPQYHPDRRPPFRPMDKPQIRPPQNRPNDMKQIRPPQKHSDNNRPENHKIDSQPRHGQVRGK